MNQNHALSHFNVFTVEEFDAPTDQDKARRATSWTRIGVAFPHKDGTGFNNNLRAFPVDGKLVMLPPNQEEAEEKSAATPAARKVRSACR